MRAKALLATAIAAVVVLRAATGMAEEATDKGGRLYENYCSNCHGEELKNNTDGLAFDLRRLKPDEHARFVNSVLNGKNRMPPWRGVLADEEIEQIWSYIRVVRGGQGRQATADERGAKAD
jgi:mono/diheme cytochrome c family protein